MPEPLLTRDGSLREYLTDQLDLSDKAADAVLAALAQWVTEHPDEQPNPDVFAELAANVTLMHASGAAMASAVWLADWLSVGTGEAVPVPEVQVATDVDRVRDAYRDLGHLAVNKETRQFYAIRDRLMRASGLDIGEAERQAMAAVRAQAERRAARLARNEVREAGVTGFTDAMTRTKRVAGWTRQTNGDNCRLCTELNDGSVLPPDQRMTRHPGCDCTQRPVMKENTRA